ncbi:MAG: LysR family transcriptional regulator [Proteobacteria bacterium]|nr:LysR family transcriptional regulator [Pseudomonadota bacterium]
MNIRDLKYLIALVEHKHFGKAADACHTSQPTLSMQIKKLEDFLGVKVVERDNRNVLVTPEGHLLAEKARTIVNNIDELRLLAKTISDPYGGEMKIGIIPTLGPYLLPLIMPKLAEAYPNLKIYLLEQKTHEILEQLRFGKLDAIILALPISDEDSTAMPLFTEEFILAVPKTHPLAKKSSVEQQQLKKEKILLLDEGHCLRAQALAICNQVNATDIQNFQATSLETLRHMVAAGTGVTFLPQLACYKNPNIHYISFADPKPHREIAMLWRNTFGRTKLLKEICDIIQKEAKIALQKIP